MIERWFVHHRREARRKGRKGRIGSFRPVTARGGMPPGTAPSMIRNVRAADGPCPEGRRRWPALLLRPPDIASG